MGHQICSEYYIFIIWCTNDKLQYWLFHVVIFLSRNNLYLPGEDLRWLCKLHNRHISKNVSYKNIWLKLFFFYKLKLRPINWSLMIILYLYIFMNNSFFQFTFLRYKSLYCTWYGIFFCHKTTNSFLSTCNISLLSLHFPSIDHDENIKCPQKRPTNGSSLFSFHSWKQDKSIFD